MNGRFPSVGSSESDSRESPKFGYLRECSNVSFRETAKIVKTSEKKATDACLLSDTGADRRIRGQAECLPLETGDRKKPFAALMFMLDSYRTSN